MTAAWVEAWMGLSVDHLYEQCPSRVRSMPRLERWGWAKKCSDLIDPLGTDVCGTCVRVWRSRQAKVVAA